MPPSAFRRVKVPLQLQEVNAGGRWGRAPWKAMTCKVWRQQVQDSDFLKNLGMNSALFAYWL